MNEPTETPLHPSAFRLEALHAGEADPQTRAHVDACAACRAYLLSLDQDRDAHAAAPLPEFLRLPANVVPLRPAGAKRGLLWLVPLAAAAAVGIFVLRPASEPADPPGLRFKGGFDVTAIRERDGRQERLSGRVLVRPGDRLRFEVTVSEATTLSLVLRPDDLPPETLVSGERVPVGAHVFTPTLRADESRTRATIYVGPPAQVEGASPPSPGEGVVSLRVESEVP